MATRLKFFISNKSESMSPGSEKMGSVKLVPVTSGSEENKSFYKYTPMGAIEFSTINQSALEELTLGSEVYITLEVVPKV